MTGVISLTQTHTHVHALLILQKEENKLSLHCSYVMLKLSNPHTAVNISAYS